VQYHCTCLILVVSLCNIQGHLFVEMQYYISNYVFIKFNCGRQKGQFCFDYLLSFTSVEATGLGGEGEAGGIQLVADYLVLFAISSNLRFKESRA